MTDQNQASAPPPNTPTAHLAEIVATAVSTDETMALIQFKDAQGKLVMLTMAVERLQGLQSICAAMRKKITRRNLPVADIALQQITNFKVGNTSSRGVIAFMFDEFMPTEAVYVMHDQDAMVFAEMIERDVLSRMTPDERRAAMAKKSPLILPHPQQLIVPENIRGS